MRASIISIISISKAGIIPGDPFATIHIVLLRVLSHIVNKNRLQSKTL